MGWHALGAHARGTHCVPTVYDTAYSTTASALGFLSISARTTSGSLLARLMFWSLPKAVHVGDPISNRGRCSSMSCSALSSRSWRSKPLRTPFSSQPVKSRARPGIAPNYGCLVAASVTRGAECISATMALVLRVASRRICDRRCTMVATSVVMSLCLLSVSARWSFSNTVNIAIRSFSNGIL